MTDEQRELTQEEIDAQTGEPLPPREVMSLIEPLYEGGGFATLPVEPPDTESGTSDV